MPYSRTLESADDTRAFRILLDANEMAVLDEDLAVHVDVALPGSYRLARDRMCGCAKESGIARVVAHAPRGHGDWIGRQRSGSR